MTKRSADDMARLRECLKQPGVSDRAVRAIWNLARPEHQLSKGKFEREVKELVGTGLACYDRHVFDDGRGGQVDFYLANLPKLIEFVGREMKSLAKIFLAALKGGAKLHGIIYHDEATACNPLAANKPFKATLIYLSYKQFGLHLHHESSWLPIGLIQTKHADRIPGAFCTCMSMIFEQVFGERWTTGFACSLDGESVWFRQRADAILIADMEGLRLSLCLKGSAGTKPCLHCVNCLKKGTGLGAGFFHEIDEFSLSKFQRASSSDIWSLADDLGRANAEERPRKELQRMEQAAGLAYVATGLFFLPMLRSRMPVEQILVDGMHCYFSNGVASWEVARFFFQSGWRLDKLREAALASAWTGPKVSKHHYPSYVRGLFADCLMTEQLYKGQASQTESIVPLLRYYIEVMADSAHGAAAASFISLADVVSEIRRLKYLWKPLAERDCQELQRLQELHHKLFVRSYGAQACKPKHHHRLHLPMTFSTIQVALRCEQNEAKHKCFKNGLAERMVSKSEEGFAASVLPRMLHMQAARLEANPLQTAVDGPAKPAQVEVQALAQDPTLQIFKSLSHFHSTVCAGDVLYFADGSAGIVQHVLCGDLFGYGFLLQALSLRSEKSWGKIWNVNDNQLNLRKAFDQSWTMPPWWRLDNAAKCLVALR